MLQGLVGCQARGRLPHQKALHSSTFHYIHTLELINYVDNVLISVHILYIHMIFTHLHINACRCLAGKVKEPDYQSRLALHLAGTKPPAPQLWKGPGAEGHVGLCTLSSWRAPSDMDCFTQLLSRSSFFTRMACHTSNTANITPQVRRGRSGIQQ